MCGRLNIINQPLSQAVSETLGIPFFVPSNHDLKPTEQVETLVGDAGGLSLMQTTWGIQPSWEKRLLINAQAETVAQKPTFRQAFAEHRCVVPCSGWYEWRDEGNQRKQKYLFEHTKGQPLYMGAIWYPTVPGEALPRIVTLTTSPNQKCAEYHHRMPVLIEPEAIGRWLSADSQALIALLIAPENNCISVSPA